MCLFVVFVCVFVELANPPRALCFQGIGRHHDSGQDLADLFRSKTHGRQKRDRKPLLGGDEVGGHLGACQTSGTELRTTQPVEVDEAEDFGEVGV